jgi:hypothetical protein
MAINMRNSSELLQAFSTAFYEDNFPELIKTYQNLQLVSSFKPTQELLKFEEDSLLCQEALGLLRSPDWDLVSETTDIKVESRYSGADFYTRAVVMIDSGMIETLSVLSEVDLLPTW